MKRYYLDNLTLFQSILKALIVNVLITIFTLLLIAIAGYSIDITVLCILGFIYLIVFITQITSTYSRKSFYLKHNTLVYCTNRKEKPIDLTKVKLIEEYYGINYVFGYKTIFIHLDNKKYSFLFKKDRADIFKTELETKLNNYEEVREFGI